MLASRIVVLGELHGTRETPRLAGEIVCAIAERGNEVVLALEVPETERGRIAAYLDSEGTAEDRTALLEGAFWNGNDGRTSVAMADLIERARGLRRHRLPVFVLAMDGQRAGLTRDAVMAQAVRDRVAERPSARVVALVGNVHGAKDRGNFFDSEYESFGYLLAPLQPLTLDVRPSKGTAWVCLAECGVHDITPPQGASPSAPGIYLGADLGPQLPYHGTVVLASAEASPPAKDRGARSPPAAARQPALGEMPETVRNNTLLAAIRRAGFYCDDVARSRETAAGVWVASCKDLGGYRIDADAAGTFRVEPIPLHFDGVL
ncbi:MAG TPA: hypothetical protein VFX89_17270 [Gammaproteobacteria bacterium]|nr:hypothetical protein [Gammaproteobacteria bacterium]